MQSCLKRHFGTPLSFPWIIYAVQSDSTCICYLAWKYDFFKCYLNQMQYKNYLLINWFKEKFSDCTFSFHQ